MGILLAFLAIIYAIVVVIAGVGCFFGLIFSAVEFFEGDEPFLVKWVKRFALSIIGVAGIIILAGVTFPPIFGSSDDSAKHCGPGTHYTSTTYTNGKQTTTEWLCVNG